MIRRIIGYQCCNLALDWSRRLHINWELIVREWRFISDGRAPWRGDAFDMHWMNPIVISQVNLETEGLSNLFGEILCRRHLVIIIEECGSIEEEGRRDDQKDHQESIVFGSRRLPSEISMLAGVAPDRHLWLSTHASSTRDVKQRRAVRSEGSQNPKATNARMTQWTNEIAIGSLLLQSLAPRIKDL